MEKVGMRFEGIARDSMFVKGKYVTIGTCAILKQDYVELYGPCLIHSSKIEKACGSNVTGFCVFTD